MRIALPGLLDSLSAEFVVTRVRRWFGSRERRTDDWRARALDAELAVLIERARSRLAERELAEQIARVAATLAWLRDFTRDQRAANDDVYRRGADDR